MVKLLGFKKKILIYICMIDFVINIEFKYDFFWILS